MLIQYAIYNNTGWKLEGGALFESVGGVWIEITTPTKFENLYQALTEYYGYKVTILRGITTEGVKS